MSDAFAADPARVSHVVVLSIFCLFAILAVVFRLWARKMQRARWELNDYLCVVALGFTLALSLFTIHSQVYWDLGGDPTQKGNPQAILSLVILQVKAMLVGQILWVTAVFFIRASIIQLYIRLFYSTKSFRITCYVIHGINFAYFAATIFGACLICRPVAYNWDPTIPGGSCGDQKSLDLFIGVFNLLLDVALVALPMPVLWGLQMSRQKKVVISGIFAMGIVICIITLIRIRITGLIDGDSNAQQIYSMIALLTCLEALLGVVNACLPVMRPIFTKFSDTKIYSFFASSSSSFTSGSGRSSGGGTSSTVSFQKPSRKQHYKIPDSSCTNTKEMHAWPSLAGSTITANSTTPGSTHPISTSRPNIHRLSDDKAAHAQVMPKYSAHQPSGDPTYLNNKKLPTTTKPPPPSPMTSKYANTDRERMTMRNSGELGQIVVQRDWDVDVEKGMKL